jgi:ketosteroid isomerase-like protein
MAGCIVVAKTETIEPGKLSGDVSGPKATVDAFFEAWTKEPGETFTTARLGRTIVGTDEFLSFDGMSQNDTVIQSWNEYAGVWGPGMNQFTRATLRPTDQFKLSRSGDLALWAGLVRVYGEMPGGQTLDQSGHMTLVLRRTGDGWRIVHEHMSLGVKR